MTLDQLQIDIDNWIRTYGVRYFNEMTNLAVLMEEVGELSRLFAREYGEQSYKRGKEPDDVKSDIANEMSDVLFVLVCLANQTGINLSEAMYANLQKKTGRDQTRHHENDKLQDPTQ